MPKRLQAQALGILTQELACELDVVSYPEGFSWGPWQRQTNKSALGPLVPALAGGRAMIQCGGSNSYLPSTVRYNRWKTLQKAYPSHPAMQTTPIWRLGQLSMTYGTRMDVDSDQGPCSSGMGR